MNNMNQKQQFYTSEQYFDYSEVFFDKDSTVHRIAFAGYTSEQLSKHTRSSSAASAAPKDPITCTFPFTLSIPFSTSASTSITCHVIHIKLSKSFSSASSSSTSAKYSPSP
ncbi:uncharacterized protein BO96DRAFT_445608 [Aspergillus niger CBS 101883]|uniref:uncharacterized protein n=1 Tax=Aspergillus lacticoffeatus (strain CBS 101883) TaxID=1450533 RepID=UPI000D7EE62F|nr:uncharacterized protein BO96DRAFT_445608 [Aspergillus niger CBS 101883]PYH57454.1 hypothetical protein BO96DRAFT_445608 [Aspergillus niger CBS 101883]